MERRGEEVRRYLHDSINWRNMKRRKANFVNNSASCIAAGATATQTNFQVLTSSNAEFDFICDS